MSLERDLFFAIRNSNENDVESILNQGVNLEVKNSKGNTPLHIATIVGNRKIIAYLLTKGANINIKNKKGDTPLHIATKKNNVLVLQYLLSEGAMIDITNKEGYTVLHISYVQAVEYYDFETDPNLSQKILEELDSRIAKDPDFRLDYEAVYDLLMHLASRYGFYNIVRYCLENLEIPVDTENQWGEISLQLAVEAKHLEIVKLLLEKGSSANAVNYAGETPLHLACMINSNDISSQRGTRGHFDDINKKIINLLLDHGADPTMQDLSGITPIHSAICHDESIVSLEIIKNLLSKINKRDNSNEEILLYALKNKRPRNTIQLILDLGCDPNIQDHEGKTALHYVEERRNKEIAGLKNEEIDEINEEIDEIIDLLLNAGADPNIEDNQGRRVRDIYKKPYILYNENLLTLKKAIIEDDTEFVRNFMLIHKNLLSYIDKDKMTALHIASKLKISSEMMELIFNSGGDIDLEDRFGNTPLYYAALNFHKETILHLINSGAILDKRNKENKTPLHMLEITGDVEILSALKESFAKTKSDLDIAKLQDNGGEIPLYYEAIYKNVAATKFSLEKVVKIDMESHDGVKAGNLSSQYDSKEVTCTLEPNYKEKFPSNLLKSAKRKVGQESLDHQSKREKT